MRTGTQLSIAALLAVGLLAFSAGAAGAAGGGKYEQATFKAEVKGVQTYAYEYNHQATDACDPSIAEATTEKVRFNSTKPVKLTATSIPQAKELILTSGAKLLLFPTRAKITRSHSNSVSSVPDSCGENGGGVPPGQGPDCGTRTIVPWRMTVDYYKRGHVELQPEDQAGSDPFERCGSGAFPYLLTGESFGKRQDAELPENEVFDERIGKIITIGKGDHLVAFPDGFEETKLRWELSITRVKGGK